MRWIDRAAIILAGSGLWALAVAMLLSSFQLPVAAYTSAGFTNDVKWIVEQCIVIGEVDVYDHPWGEIVNSSISC